MMKPTNLALVLPFLIGCAAGASAQPGPSPARTPAQVVGDLIAMTEKQLTRLAAEMPADKYDFAPTAGAFRGVRTFAKQVKHAAAVHFLVAKTILGEPITADIAEERGPDSVRTKAEILEYLQESFGSLRRAAATIDETNAFAPMKGAVGSAPDTRLGLVVVALTHASNHYGQIVEYLRMNGLVPPQTP